jgi:hypothetical protein
MRHARHFLCRVRRVSDAPQRCFLCHGGDVIVRNTSGKFIVLCRGCGAEFVYTPRPLDDPALAGRIELFTEPHQSQRSRARVKSKHR